MQTPLHLQPFNPQPFVHRRQQLLHAMRARCPHGVAVAVAVLPTGSEVPRNRDSHYDFRPDSYFYYLTGFTEPDAWLVLIAAPQGDRCIVFCREKNIEREIWDGRRLGPEQAVAHLQVDEACAVDELDARLPDYFANAQAVFTAINADANWTRIQAALNATRARTRTGITAPETVHEVSALLDEMRLIKDATELAWMRDAGRISAAGHVRAMRACRVGLRELDLEAELRHEFMRHGAQDVAYNTIVAAGENACVLHYRAGLRQLRDGDLCLIDAGAEYGFYAGDITRTFPVNGRFSPAQKAVYEVVLAAQTTAIETTRAGAAFDAPHWAAVRVLTQGLLDLGILDKHRVGSLDDALEQQAYQPFYMHRTGHWLGLDVHDCGEYRAVGTEGGDATDDAAEINKQAAPKFRPLQAGMVLTVEPGLYIRPAEHIPTEFWHIGIRIEDDAIVTEHGCELTTRDVPVAVDDIERLMKA